MQVMNILVFGLGMNGGGLAAAEYFLDHGETVRVTDLKGGDDLQQEVDTLTRKGAVCITGVHRDEDFQWADVVIKNPAIPPDNPLLKDAKAIKNDMWYLFTSPFSQNVKFIAVTGTKGKTTTCFAIAHALKAMGHTAQLCGNMGISAFTVLTDWEAGNVPEYLVIEMSSWQIRDTYTALGESMPPFEAAVLTAFYPDHQNSYHSMEEYLDDKLKLFQAKDRVILVPETLKAAVSSTRNIPLSRIHTLDGASSDFEESLRPAATTLSLLFFKNKDIEKAFATFGGVPHRSECVACKGSVTFINDSAATIAEAVHFSLSRYRDATIHLITGGTDKNLSPEAMTEDLKRAESVTLLSGSFTTKKLLPLLDSLSIPYGGPFTTMREAVKSAYEAAKKEETLHPLQPQVVILSPGCASFELFINEFDRGDQFRAEAVSLASPDTVDVRQANSMHRRNGQPSSHTSDVGPSVPRRKKS